MQFQYNYWQKNGIKQIGKILAQLLVSVNVEN
jgi:hypothetical protein